MDDGLYVARFRTPLDEAAGVIVISGDAVMGGDSGMYYHGRISADGDKITVKMVVHRHNEVALSVFGDFAFFALTLTGKRRGDAYEFEGRADAAPVMRFSATLTKAQV